MAELEGASKSKVQLPGQQGSAPPSPLLCMFRDRRDVPPAQAWSADMYVFEEAMYSADDAATGRRRSDRQTMQRQADDAATGRETDTERQDEMRRTCERRTRSARSTMDDDGDEDALPPSGSHQRRYTPPRDGIAADAAGLCLNHGRLGRGSTGRSEAVPDSDVDVGVLDLRSSVLRDGIDPYLSLRVPDTRADRRQQISLRWTLSGGLQHLLRADQLRKAGPDADGSLNLAGPSIPPKATDQLMWVYP
ncbi:hypothetical protein RJ55_05567 [Drechmeria coniospora]|nr:hypothetical protein RJ55_05567 [Drechmeria coniospora]